MAALLGVSEAAKLLGVSAPTLRRLADSGQLPAFRLPSGWRRFDANEVEVFKQRLRLIPAKERADA